MIQRIGDQHQKLSWNFVFSSEKETKLISLKHLIHPNENHNEYSEKIQELFWFSF